MLNFFRSKWLTVLALMALAVLLYQPIFGHLDTLPLRQWDETRLAHSALEMYQNGLSIVVTFAGQPEMWSTKPPLMIWAQTLSMHVFGPEELGVRFPSALAALLTCVVLILFSKKYLKSIWPGIISSLVLITTQGYIGQHGTRTGDYDSLLTLFTTAYLFCFFLYSKSGRIKYLYLFFIALTLGGLTKGISAFLFLPAVAAFAFWQKQGLSLLKNKHFYLGLLIVVAGVGGYYAGREALNPGYLQAVWDNELGGRYLEVLDQHQHSGWWYINNMFWTRFQYWIPYLLIGFVFNFYSKNTASKSLNFYLLLNSVFYLVVISTAQTKLEWYDIPLFPLFALVIGLFLYNLSKWFIGHVNFASVPKKTAPTVFALVVLLFKPYMDIIDKTYKPEEIFYEADFYRMGHYLQMAMDGHADVHNRTIVHQGIYTAHLWYYVRLLNDENVNVSVELNNFDKFGTGDTLLIYQDNVKNHYAQKFNFQKVESYHNIEAWALGEPKVETPGN